MDKEKRDRVLEILAYWEMMEFLGQIDIPEQTLANKRLLERIERGEKTDEEKIERFIQLNSTYFNVTQQLEEDQEKLSQYPVIGEKIYYCIGKIERNSIVEYLERFIDNREESPEIAYPKKSAIAWYSFETDTEGIYIQGTFQLSPILWAISVWERTKVQKNHDFDLDKNKYNEIVSNIDKSLQGKNVSQFFAKIYKKIRETYISKLFQEESAHVLGFVEYNRYSNEKKRSEDEEPTDYANLGKSYFLNDIVRFKNLIKDGVFGDKSAYEESVIAYILSAYDKASGVKNSRRTIISSDEPVGAMRNFFEDVLDICNAPMGKWPAKFMPALMQQVAVNIAIQQNDNTPIFSVNGPPGTGKTTLLKEVVANNIVARAKLLAENGTNPDTLFAEHLFMHGPLKAHGNSYDRFAPEYYSIKNDAINNYSMLVASCNNAAVENITVDLPKGKDILESLEGSSNEDAVVRDGLQEVYDLFDIDKSQDIEIISAHDKKHEVKDIYFTRYANRLLGTNGCWGLVSAPFGKKSNLRKYCNAVLKPYVEEYKTDDSREVHKEKYIEARKRFLQQYALVEKLGKEIEDICTLAKSIPSKLEEMSEDELSQYADNICEQLQIVSAKLKLEQKDLRGLEPYRPKWLKWLLSIFHITTKADPSIEEKKRLIDSLKSEVGEYEAIKSSIVNLKEYRTKLQQYSKGNKSMVPINAEFMRNYASNDAKESTKAQVTNPWFTAEYNREREKLFLYACKLHKEFVLSSKCMMRNVVNLMIAWGMLDDCDVRMKSIDRETAMPYLLQSIFLLTPVISTTFASAQMFLGDISESGVLGTLIVDEAGQAQPQMTIGAMFRCRKAIIVGDPKQIEPVVTAELDMIKQLFTSGLLDSYKDKKISVQSFADYINPYGTFLGKDDEKEWVGCPLVVHRRCIDPMYTISNVLSYDGTMKQQTGAPKEERARTFILNESCWIDVNGNENSGAKDHFVNAQGEIVLKLLEEKFKKDPGDIPRLFIITPFKSVKKGMEDMIRGSSLYQREPRVRRWLEKKNIGTVHTFQGQGTDEVIFLLGCDRNSIGVANWVNKNLVNVAATRAKYRFYIIGDKNVWTCKPVRIAREYTEKIISGKDIDGILGYSTMDMAEENKSKYEISVNRICPKCGKPLIERNGIYGKFLGCTGFPGCRYTRKE